MFFFSAVPPVHGNYTEWSKWTNCSVTCGQGERSRYRTCTNPSPKRGGRNCMEQSLGVDTEVDKCILSECPGLVCIHFSDLVSPSS